MKCTVSFLLSILSFTILFVQPAHGQIRPFVPRILGYSGEVRVDSLYETEIEESQNNRIERVKTTFRQDLKLDLFGYTYHPRFNIFSIRGSLGLDQRKLKLNDNRQPWNFTTSDQYDIRTIFLPQHPYNLELYTSQTNPILAGSLSSDKPSQTRESGAIFKYDLEPWLVNARFISTKISDQNDRNTRSNLYDGNATYTNPIATLGGFINHNEIVAESNDIEIDGFGAFNNLRIGVANLDTFYSVTQDDTKQNQVLISKRRRMSWNQTVSIPLPLRFSATGYYRQDEEIEGFTDPDTGQLFERFNDRNRLKLALQHRLYNSLTTSLDATRNSTKATGGKSKIKAYNLNLNYNKKLPRKNHFNVFAFGKLDNLEQEGAITERERRLSTGNELLPDPDRQFLIPDQNVDTTTIFIEVADDLDSDGFFETRATLTENVHYTLNTTFEPDFVLVDITSLPAGFDIADIETFTFLTSYSIKPAQFEIETRTVAYTIRTYHFNRKVSPYYKHTRTRQKEIEGNLPGEPERIRSDVAGLLLYYGPVNFGFEYARLVSVNNPKRTYTAYTEYRRKVASYTTFVGGAEYKDENFLLEDPSNLQSNSSVRTITANLILSSAIPRKGLNVAGGLTFSNRDGLSSETDRFNLFTNVSWHVGKLDVKFTGRLENARTHLDQNDELRKSFSSSLFLQIIRRFY